ncbi:hypothetical protein XH88_36820 [Bradyrhizobium sp. CCBAU 51627]|nr:hypothetical protein [Bradyrhizobium sp. CCBAU 51627]
MSKNLIIEGDDQPPYSVHEQHASERDRALLGPALSRHETIDAAIEDAKTRGRMRRDKSFAVCSLRNVVVWPP